MAGDHYRGGTVSEACFFNCPKIKPLLKAAFLDDGNFPPTDGLVRIPNGRCLVSIEVWRREAGNCSGPRDEIATSGETVYVCPVADIADFRASTEPIAAKE
jgi:hypothetical protein